MSTLGNLPLSRDHLLLELRARRKVLDDYWFRYDKILQDFESRQERIWRQFFDFQAEVAMEVFSKLTLDDLKAAASTELNLQAVANKLIIGITEDKSQTDQVKQRLEGSFTGVADRFAASTAVGLGFKYPGLPNETSKWLKSYVPPLVDQINQNSMEGIKRVVRNGIEQGKTLKDIELGIRDQYDGWVRSRPSTIARTEVGKVAAKSEYTNVGGLPVHQDDVLKTWLDSRDNAVRDSHMSLNGDQVPYKERFSNGLLYPKEPGGAAAEVINCRCVNKYDLKKNAKVQTQTQLDRPEPSFVGLSDEELKRKRERISQSINSNTPVDDRLLKGDDLVNEMKVVGAEVRNRVETRVLKDKAQEFQTLRKELADLRWAAKQKKGYKFTAEYNTARSRMSNFMKENGVTNHNAIATSIREELEGVGVRFYPKSRLSKDVWMEKNLQFTGKKVKKDNVAEALSRLPRGMVDRVKEKVVIRGHNTPRFRAYHEARGSKSILNVKQSEHPSVIAHEFVHSVDNNIAGSPGLMFVNDRADRFGGFKLEPIYKDRTSSSKFGVEEGYFDNFTKPYIGKSYSTFVDTEVNTMGIEGVMFGRHDIYTEDEDMVDYILGFLAAF